MVDHAGLWEADGAPWLGMPEFPYFCSQVDCRMPRQTQGGSVIGHQWDFCGSRHFIGPVTWQYRASAGKWEPTERSLRESMEEGRILTEMSGHPAFLYTLYEGITPQAYPRPGFSEGVMGKPHRDFAERVLHFMTFGLSKQYKLAFARSIDVSDYYLRHFKVTPRTVFSSRITDWEHDKWWLVSVMKRWRTGPEVKVISWDTRISDVLKKRRQGLLVKDTLSWEYLMVEDQRRSIRFERECPNPIWWFDYKKQQRRPKDELLRLDAKPLHGIPKSKEAEYGSVPIWTDTPDVAVERSDWVRSADAMSITLKMNTTAKFPDYAICLWGLPKDFAPDGVIQTNAKEHVLAKNTAREYHLVLLFDLEPNTELKVSLRRR